MTIQLVQTYVSTITKFKHHNSAAYQDYLKINTKLILRTISSFSYLVTLKNLKLLKFKRLKY